MRSEIGKLDLDKTFQERASLNVNIKQALNEASLKWGIFCMRYEIKDIKPPEPIKKSMGLQSESERVKRSNVLESEGQKQSIINIAEGKKQSIILDGEGAAETILQEARSLAEAITNLGNSIQPEGASQATKNALKLRITTEYLKALEEIYGSVKIVSLPEDMKGGNTGSELTRELVKSMIVAKETVGATGMSVPSQNEVSADQLKNLKEEIQTWTKNQQKNN